MADNSHLKSLEEDDEQGTGREITPETTPETETGRGAEEEGEAARWSLKTQGKREEILLQHQVELFL